MRSWSSRSSGCYGTATSVAGSAVPARSGDCCAEKASSLPAALSSASCASRACAVSAGASSSSPPALTLPRRGQRITSNASFHADRPNELWVVDFTYVPTWSGMAFTAFVTDVFSRRIVGWRTMSKMPTDLPLDALEIALWIRDRAGEDVTGVIQHSDAGTQYTAPRYTERLADVGAIASIGTVGDSYDNALAESVVGLYKTECVKIDGPFRSADDLELATLSWVHWFNENRLHSSIGYLTPIEKENEYYREMNSQRQPALGELTLH